MQQHKLLHPLEQDRVRRALSQVMNDDNLTFPMIAMQTGLHSCTLRRFMLNRKHMGINTIRTIVHFLSKRGYTLEEE